MRIPCVVFDFDGTLTDVEHHAPRYEEAFRAELARRAGLAPRELDDAWRAAAAEVEARPELGWTYEQRVVAPARADPYLFANTVAQRILADRLDDEARARVVYEAYGAAYRGVPTRFREDARDALDGLLARGVRLFVVTNAAPRDVRAKLDALGVADAGAIAIRGEARKFRVCAPSLPDARFDSLPVDARLPGLARPVLLRRGHYFDALAGVWDDAGVTPERTLVCGDVFELDLALPAALGAHVHLAAHGRTLPYERAAVLALPRGAVGSLGDVLARVSGA